VIALVGTSSSMVVATWSSPAARADGAVADYSRHVTGELALVPADANRDDPDLVGHRPTELTLEERAA
jgi:hypothetical protein